MTPTVTCNAGTRSLAGSEEKNPNEYFFFTVQGDEGEKGDRGGMGPIGITGQPGNRVMFSYYHVEKF